MAIGLDLGFCRPYPCSKARAMNARAFGEGLGLLGVLPVLKGFLVGLVLCRLNSLHVLPCLYFLHVLSYTLQKIVILLLWVFLFGELLASRLCICLLVFKEACNNFPSLVLPPALLRLLLLDLMMMMMLMKESDISYIDVGQSLPGCIGKIICTCSKGLPPPKLYPAILHPPTPSSSCLLMTMSTGMTITYHDLC